MWIHRIVGAALMLTAAWPAPAQVAPAAVERGRKLAKEACATCHAISGSGPSRMKDAPVFSTLLMTFPGRNLDEILARGLMSPHVTMPVFLATSQNMDDLLAYLTTVQVKRMAGGQGATP